MTSRTGSSPAPEREDPLAAYTRLLERARADPGAVGVVVYGSRAVGVDLTADSDVDCFVIVGGSDDEAQRWKTTYAAPVEVWPMTLDEFRRHALPGDDTAWNRPTFIRARVDLDKLDGEIGAIVDRKRRLTRDEATALVGTDLDDAINSIYRALKSAEAGRVLAASLDANEAIGPLLRTVFALEGRVRPWNRWLQYELAQEPLRTPAFVGLMDRLSALTADPTADRIRDAFRTLDVAARDAGHGALIDAWEPYVAWLRGEGPYRSR